MKKLLFYVALASLTLTTSCSQDDLVSHRTSENEIQFHASMGMKSRASETTTLNLNTFYVTAFQSGEKNYMQDVDYTKTTEGDNTKWTHSGTDTYYWPTSEGLNFYAYAPKTPGKAGTLSIGSDAQTLTGFQPNAAAKDQQDFIYATTTGSKEKNAQSGIDLTFNHALSQISIQAKNGNGAYTVTVTGVKIGGVKDQGTFTFPSTTDDTKTAAWSDCSTTTGGGSYETTWTTAATLNGTAAQMSDENVSFMLIPQTLTKNTTKYSAGSYIALKATIQMQGGEKLVDDAWIYVGIGDTWAMGKHYTYTLDFTNGAGQDSEGNQIISGKEIAVAVDVTEWNNSEKYVVNPDISTTPTEANCLIMNSPGKVYAINIASKPNAFWTSTAAGTDKMETAPITDDTEWTAEVIWQDITNYEWETGEEPSKPVDYTQKRAIDFYDLTDGAKTSVDTYSGKGKTLYIQLRNAYRGNIVVGVKKKDAQDSDGYLWSWHLWLTEDPLCIGGFMDRNLGATGGLMTTASHPGDTFGTFYQFGRKDPLARDIHYFDINGDLITKWEEYTSNGETVRPYILSGPKSFAEVVKNPLQLCATKAKGEWTTSADYVANQWYDINGTTSGSTTKTIFDPSPDGWRLPTKSEIYTVITNGAVGSCIWNNNYTLKGWVYNGNWFAASGYLQCQASENETFHNEEKSGFVWSSEPVPNGEGEDRKAYGIYFNITNGESAQTSTNRGDAASVRCVPE